MVNYDPAMYKAFLKATINVKQNCFRHLKDNYIVRKSFFTYQGDQIRVGSTSNPTIISCHKHEGQIIHQYKMVNRFGKTEIRTTPVKEDYVDFVPDGYMQKQIQVIKAYCDHRLNMSFPEVTLISDNRYKIQVWDLDKLL